jgi:hypothetical protein
MAVTVLTPEKGALNKISAFTPIAATAPAEGFEFTMPKTTEEYVVVIAQNSGSGAGKLTLKKPINGSYAAASSDTELSMAAGSLAQIRIESARYADNKGKVKLIPASADIKVAVIY